MSSSPASRVNGFISSSWEWSCQRSREAVEHVMSRVILNDRRPDWQFAGRCGLSLTRSSMTEKSSRRRYVAVKAASGHRGGWG
ncbi:hypothetical protein K443DRAFT_686052 [Laccaria amethystina LaAM-08-1]|uniref:Uncharacterized protein n=1 Tax=Laccaria amethystina LaAM-08-1 TaxID=1095629 RepID=A0A0C9WHL9_9AGAR|nr:hypothetical protein K443DRAFT_686052 [Laccaria amethystina LaAM-08-1]